MVPFNVDLPLLLIFVELAAFIYGVAAFGLLEWQARQSRKPYQRLIGFGILASAAAFLSLLIGQALVIFGYDRVGYVLASYVTTASFDVSGMLASLGVIAMAAPSKHRRWLSACVIAVFLWSLMAFIFSPQLFTIHNGLPVGDLRPHELLGDMASLVLLFISLLVVSFGFLRRRFVLRDRHMDSYQAYIGSAGLAGITLLVAYLAAGAVYGDAAVAVSFLLVPVLHTFLFLGAISKDHPSLEVARHPWKVVSSTLSLRFGALNVIAIVLAGLALSVVMMIKISDLKVKDNVDDVRDFAGELAESRDPSNGHAALQIPAWLVGQDFGYGTMVDGHYARVSDARPYSAEDLAKLAAALSPGARTGYLSDGPDSYYLAATRLPAVQAFVRVPNLSLTRSALREAFAAAFAITVILGLLGLLNLYGIVLILRPVARLAEATRSLTRGRYDKRLDASRLDEFGQLAASFNAMADTIKARDSSLAAAVEQQRTFMLSAAHDFKNPLSHFRWSLEILEQDLSAAMTAEQRDLIVSMRRTVARLGLLASDIIEMTRLDERKIKPHLVEVDLQAALDEVASDFVSSMRERGLTFVWDRSVAQGLPAAWVDPGIVSRVVRNLISNAEKYTPIHGTVTLGVEALAPARRGSRMIRVSVSDTGRGIPKKEQSRIFERFYRASNVVGLNEEGTGIGLTMCRDLLKLIGGRISFESEEGRGTAFHVDLPVADQGRRGRGEPVPADV